jgi:hypothetical protein
MCKERKNHNNPPLVGSSKNKIDGLVTSSQAILTLLFSPPLILLFPLSPILESLIPQIPSSFIVSNILNFFASKLISRGSNLKSALRLRDFPAIDECGSTD